MVIPAAGKESESVPASDVLVPPTTVIMLRDAWPGTLPIREFALKRYVAACGY